MANAIQNRSKKFIKATKSIDKLTQKILKDLEYLIIDFNTEQLQKYGMYSDGGKLPLPYEPVTIEYKKAKGQPTDRITLYDEGDFQNKFYVKYSNVDFSLWSTDGKTENLVKEWGKEIFGLTDSNLTKLIKEVKPLLLTELRRII